MKLRIFISFSLLSCGVLFSQQQTLFTNYMLNQYLYNPAYAGVFKGFEMNANYRQQWAGFEGAPVTAIASLYGTFNKKPNMAVGGLVINDRTGLIGRTALYASYSYHLRLSKKLQLGFGVSGGNVNYSVKMYNAQPYDKDDDFLKTDILNANAFDANAGLYLHSRAFFFGFSCQQLANAKIQWTNSFGRLTPHYYATTGVNITLDKKKKDWVIQPSVLARFNAPAPYQVEGTLRVIYKNAFWIGGNYRMGASAAGMFGCTVSKLLTVAYSYDYATTSLQKYSNGSHEILLRISIESKKQKAAIEKTQSADETEFNTIDNSIKTNLKNNKKDGENK